MNVSLRQLRAFLATVESGSFTRAAHRLHLSQSAVSMIIRQLEIELGLDLFSREKKRLILTDMGHQLEPIARRMMDELDLIASRASEIRQLQSGSLRMAVPEIMACTLMPPILTAFNNTHPSISIKLHDTTLNNIPLEVARGAVELGIGPERSSDPGVERIFLCSVPICLVCAKSHHAAQRDSVRWSELRNEKWIYYPSTFGKQIQAALGQLDRSRLPEDATVVERLTTALALAGQGGGVTIAPRYADALQKDFQVRIIPLVEPQISSALYVYKRHGRALSPPAFKILELFSKESRLTGDIASGVSD
ncbi:LysR family transcriptional regulator [Nitratireductor sp. StC3]|uniref:LysR family transcriptional regulator n=1 Tax=Nitratireductor sp. StC3 TaxID=2126741 RepID=UPI000D0D38DA|nr:LysR family transcriptional regulator [Nitratireductor sp. StC3]PSM15919.1 LysR family transcriptional regulator [Nitratireductor sp. StC3]